MVLAILLIASGKAGLALSGSLGTPSIRGAMLVARNPRTEKTLSLTDARAMDGRIKSGHDGIKNFVNFPKVRMGTLESDRVEAKKKRRKSQTKAFWHSGHKMLWWGNGALGDRKFLKFPEVRIGTSGNFGDLEGPKLPGEPPSQILVRIKRPGKCGTAVGSRGIVGGC